MKGISQLLIDYLQIQKRSSRKQSLLKPTPLSRPYFTICTNPMSLSDKIWSLLPTRKIKNKSKTLLCWLWFPPQSSDRPAVAGAPFPTTTSMCDRALCATPWLVETSGRTHVCALKKKQMGNRCDVTFSLLCVRASLSAANPPMLPNMSESKIVRQTPVKDD